MKCLSNWIRIRYLISAFGQSTAQKVPKPRAAYHKFGNRLSSSFKPCSIVSPAFWDKPSKSWLWTSCRTLEKTDKNYFLNASKYWKRLPFSIQRKSFVFIKTREWYSEDNDDPLHPTKIARFIKTLQWYPTSAYFSLTIQKHFTRAKTT